MRQTTPYRIIRGSYYGWVAYCIGRSAWIYGRTPYEALERLKKKLGVAA